MSNYLLEIGELPAYSKITPEMIQPAVSELIEKNKNAITNLLNDPQPIDFERLIVDLDDQLDLLNQAWGTASHLHNVSNTDELREAYSDCLSIISDYGTWLSQNQALYNAHQYVYKTSKFGYLDQDKKRLLELSLRDFKLSGIELNDEKQQELAEINQRLSEITTQFSNNVLDATNGWTKLITNISELDGLPQSALDAAKQAATEQEQTGWFFTLQYPSYLPILTYANNAELRREFYYAANTRASEIGPNAGQWDNTAHIDEILALRHRKAVILGFDNYAEKSLATKMVESPEQVIDFLQGLAEKSRTRAIEEYAELQAFAKEQGHEELNAWDIAYFSEQLKQTRYAISDEELKPYFPADTVIQGAFETVNRLYGITFKIREAVDVWDDAVTFYDVYDLREEYRGSFYVDLFARSNKRGGAWMDECMLRRRDREHGIQHPVALLNCNFQKPIGDKPALLTHDEVVTFFHEFGHTMHHVLTTIEYSSISGINGVPWDAVELPSQLMENWCWQEKTLAFLSSHYETHEPLPKDKLDKLLALKNFQSSLAMVRQLEFALFDFRIHHEFDPSQSSKVTTILEEVRQTIGVIPVPEFNRFQNSFSHIFAGGYAAGYYSYKWAEMLSSDAFSKFEEEGIFSSSCAHYFMYYFLEKGGSVDAMTAYKNFRGREPNIDALLRHSGI